MNPRQRRTAIVFAPLTGLTGMLGGLTKATRQLDAVRAAFAPLTGMFRAVTRAGRLTKAVRSTAQQCIALKETEAALADMRPHVQRELTEITVRCPRNKQVLRVVRIPAYLPGAAYDTHLVIPTSATTYRYDNHRIKASAWYLAEHDETSGARCRCHPEVKLSRAQLRRESPPPPGYLVAVFPGVRVTRVVSI